MTRFQFKPESGKKQKRADQRVKDREESSRDDRFPNERYDADGRPGRAHGANKTGKAGKSGKTMRGLGVRSSGRSSGHSSGHDARRDEALAGAAGAARDAFSALIRQTAGDLGLGPKLDPEPAPLALLDYKTELDLKNASIRAWWTQHAIPDKPGLVIPSPLPRHYRSTSKRRLIRKGETWRWDFFLERLGGTAKAGIDALEPAAHEAVYKFALEKLNEEPYRALANSINFLIVRGDAEQMVIFNVFRLNADVIRKAKLLGEHLSKISGAKVVAAHVFYDKTRSDYYIEARVSEGPFRLKTLFGPEFLPITVEGRRFLLHPTGFFQVNTSILPRVIAEVTNALKPRPDDRLIDLYCGCGLFTLPVAASCAEAYGVEGSPVSIEAALKAAGAASRRNTRFTAARMDAKSLPRVLPPADGRPEILLLDPPRQGTAPGVIPLLAARAPRRVAYLFCDMNVMPSEISKWRKQGYMVAKAMPFDMFPGTNNLEMLVVLIPDKFGLLGRKKPKVEAVDEEEAANAERKGRASSLPAKSGYVPKNKVGAGKDKSARQDQSHSESRPQKPFKPRAQGGKPHGMRQAPSGAASPFSGSTGMRRPGKKPKPKR